MKPVRWLPPRNQLIAQCWSCGTRGSLMRRPENAVQAIAPKDDDLIVCGECEEISIVDRSMPDGVRKPSPRESDDIRDRLLRLMKLMKENPNAKKIRSDPG